MRKKILSTLIICIFVFSSVFVASSCGNDAEEEPIVNPIDITISINYPNRANLEDVVEEAFKIEEESTALDAIQLYCNVHEMPVNVEVTGGAVQGINDVDNGEYGQRQWRFKINGELQTTTSGQVVLNDGDHLEWVYRKIN